MRNIALCLILSATMCIAAALMLFSLEDYPYTCGIFTAIGIVSLVAGISNLNSIRKSQRPKMTLAQKSTGTQLQIRHNSGDDLNNADVVYTVDGTVIYEGLFSDAPNDVAEQMSQFNKNCMSGMGDMLKSLEGVINLNGQRSHFRPSNDTREEDVQ